MTIVIIDAGEPDFTKLCSIRCVARLYCSAKCNRALQTDIGRCDVLDNSILSAKQVYIVPGLPS